MPDLAPRQYGTLVTDPQPGTWVTDPIATTGRQPDGTAWYVLNEQALDELVRGRPVSEMVEAARAAGGTVVDPAELPFSTPDDAVVAVRVRAAVTHTIAGLRVDEQVRVVGAEGLWAAGVDAGGWSTGGYASGLAAALVLGLTAAESASS